MRKSVQDHFSDRAAASAEFRPSYPDVLFAAIAAAAPGTALAWDCGTGNGQAAVGLAAHFAAVTATDPSAEQIARARPHPRVTYRVGRERESGLASGSADAVTVAQALHWLDLDAFYTEATRVLSPDGVLVAWCYDAAHVSPDVDPPLRHFQTVRLGPWWPPERRLVDAGYAGLPFPFRELALPGVYVIERTLTRDAFCAYVRTWSAVRRFVQQHGEDPVLELEAGLAHTWAPGAERLVRWPLRLRAGRRPTAALASAGAAT